MSSRVNDSDRGCQQEATPFRNRPRGYFLPAQSQWTPASDRAGSISTADKKANLVPKIRSSRKAQWSASATLIQAIKGTFSVSLPVAIVNSEDYRSISLSSNYEGMKI